MINSDLAESSLLEALPPKTQILLESQPVEGALSVGWAI